MERKFDQLSKRLAHLRKEVGMTQEELADAIGLKRSAIAQYETGHRKEPEYEVLDKLAHYFDVSVDYLMGRTSVRASLNHVEEGEQTRVEIDEGNDIGRTIADLTRELGRQIEAGNLTKEKAMRQSRKIIKAPGTQSY